MNVFNSITKGYKKLLNGISFVPTVLAIGIFLFALFINFIQHTRTGTELLKVVKFIKFENPDTVRSLLSALLTGIISLTVFSFTMVMVVVNQSASNYSPKVIDEFISKKLNQVILGIYIGTILFIIVGLTQIGNNANDFSDIPHFNVFFSIVLMVLSIALFIVFIETISASVRINNVIVSIFKKTLTALKESSGINNNIKQPVQEWFPYKAENSGYFQSITSKRLLTILKENEIVLQVNPYFGTYLLHDYILFYTNKEINDKKLLNRIKSTFITYSGENVSENYFYGFRQLREVAVKALSPGINDPGVAIICLDYLSELLALYISIEKNNSLIDEDGTIRVIFKRHSFTELLNLTITPILTYSKKDFLVLGQILIVLGNISLKDNTKEHQATLSTIADFVLDTVKENIKSKPELEYIDNIIIIICNSGYFHLKILGPN